MKTKRATIGERLEMIHLAASLPGTCKDLHDFRTRGLFNLPRASAKRIDAEVRRVIRSAFAWGTNCGMSIQLGDEKQAEQSRYQMERLFGTKVKTGTGFVPLSTPAEPEGGKNNG